MSESIFHMWGGQLKQLFYFFIVAGLIVVNFLTLTNSVIHDALYSGLANLPLSSWIKNSDSPTKKNKSLKKKNKKLTQDSKALQKKNSKLTRRLDIETKKNIANRNHARKITKRIAKRTARNTAYNIASIPTESVPYYGIGVVLAVTAVDIKDACDSMKDMDKLMVVLGEQGNEAETGSVCGHTVPGKEAVISKIRFSKEQYRKLQILLGGLMHKMEQDTEEGWVKFYDSFGGTIYEIIN